MLPLPALDNVEYKRKAKMPQHLPIYEQNYTAEERELADHIIGLEKKALDK